MDDVGQCACSYRGYGAVARKEGEHFRQLNGTVL